MEPKLQSGFIVDVNRAKTTVEYAQHEKDFQSLPSLRSFPRDAMFSKSLGHIRQQMLRVNLLNQNFSSSLHPLAQHVVLAASMSESSVPVAVSQASNVDFSASLVDSSASSPPPQVRSSLREDVITYVRRGRRYVVGAASTGSVDASPCLVGRFRDWGYRGASSAAGVAVRTSFG